MKDESIADSVRKCLEEFQLLKQVESPTATDSDRKAALEIVEGKARFNIWSGNIGAHSTGRRSLQYRLRDASHLQKQVVSLLEELSELLADAYAIVIGEKVPWDHIEDDESIGFDSKSESDDDDVPATEMSQISQNVSDVIDCLLRLSVAIRNPAPHDRFATHMSIDASHFEPFDIEHVTSKFSKIEPFLADRLGRAISRRRQYFKYRESHHLKMSQGLHCREPNDGDSTVASSLPQHVKATDFSLEAVDEDEASDSGITQTSFASSHAGGDKLRVPPLPMKARNGPFECPFCHMMIVATNSLSWKRHVFADLRPYVCLSKDCTASEMEFMRRREWMLHEVQNHWKKYPCPCACGAIFPAKILCQEHVNEIHCDAFPKHQVGSMIDLSSKPIKLEDGTFCPFCREPLHSAKEYQRHAGRHQEQLALFALPQLEGGGDEAQSENGTSRENSSNPSEGFHTERLEIQIVNGSLADDEAPPKSPQDNTDDGHFGTFVRPRQELPEGPGAVSKDALPHEGQEERDAPSGEGWTKISRQVFDAQVLKLREAMGIDESSDIEGGVIMSPRKLTPTEIDRYVTAMRALQEKRRRDEDAISDGICPAWMQSKIFEDLPIPSPTTEDPRISQDNTRIGKETESSEGEVSEEQGEMRVSPKRPEELNQDEATSFTDDLRPTSGDSVLVAYLDNGRDPEIARAAGRESLPVDEDSDYSQYSGVSDRKDKAAALLQAHPMRRKEKDREGEEPGWALNQPKEGSRVAPIKVDKDNNDASSEAQKRAQRKSEFERSIESHPLLKEIEDTW